MPDRLVTDLSLLCLVVFGLGLAYGAIPGVLERVRELARSPAKDLEGGDKTQSLEDDATEALSTKTLLGLADSHSYELRNAALKIIGARASRGAVREALLRDLESKDDDIRDRAINGLWLLIYSPPLSDKQQALAFSDLATFNALITALVNVLPQHNRAIPDVPHSKVEILNNNMPCSPLCPPNRPAHEISLMIMLRELLVYRGDSRYNPRTPQHSIERALEAGLVTRWLVNYPFPCGLSTNAHMNYKRSDVASLFERKAWASDDALMAEIFQTTRDSSLGVKQLREVGLRDRSYKKPYQKSWSTPWNHAWDDDENETAIIDSNETQDEQPWFEFQSTEQPRPRSGDLSRDEERTRRRHREAVVVANPGEPLTQDNILQRQTTASDDPRTTPTDITDDVYDTDFVVGPELSRQELRRSHHQVSLLMHIISSWASNLLSLRDIRRILYGPGRLPYLRRLEVHDALRAYWDILDAELGPARFNEDGSERSREELVEIFGQTPSASAQVQSEAGAVLQEVRDVETQPGDMQADAAVD